MVRLHQDAGRRLLHTILALVSLSGCAYSMIQNGAVRPGPMQEIVANTVRARGIEPREKVTARVVDRDGLTEILAAAITQRKTRSELADYQRGLVALGLWPADRDLYEEVLAVYGEEMVGVYVPSRGELFLVADAHAAVGMRFFSAIFRRDLVTEFSLSHEIIHLLQHQAYPDLMDPDRMPKYADDLDGAIQAAIEGDAMRYGFDAMGWTLPTPEYFRTQMEAKLDDGGDSALADAPALIRLTLDFPYARGYRLAWNEGHRLLEQPPISTEQVLHPDRRFEPFLQLDLTALVGRLPSGCRTLQRNTVGELQLSVLFRDLSEDPIPAIWEGWNGDRYLVADCQGRAEWVWWTAWDSEADAAEFEQAYRELAPAVATRAGFAIPPSAKRNGTHVVVTTSGFADEAAWDPPTATRVADFETLRALLLDKQ